MRLARPADMDDAGGLELVAEDIHDELEHVVIERPERAVDEHPGRRLEQDAREHQAQLLVLTQFPIPAVGLVEQQRRDARGRAGRARA